MSALLDNNLSSLLVPFLQKPLVFMVKGKVIKRGRLLLFKKSHFFLQFSLETCKKMKENLDVPHPFNIEFYSDEDLLYFDYRLSSLMVENLPTISHKVPSLYFNNILEIQVT